MSRQPQFSGRVRLSQGRINEVIELSLVAERFIALKYFAQLHVITGTSFGKIVFTGIIGQFIIASFIGPVEIELQCQK